MKLKFPYVIERTFEFGSIPIINLWLNVKSTQGIIPFSFLFDTGADVTSMPISAAKRLGIDLDRCPRLPMSGYEGTTISVFKSKIAIEFEDKTFKIACVFNPNNDVPILLGRAGIMDRFNILLDAKKKEVTFEEI